MATAAVTTTFIAGTAAKASEVNTNFSDLVTFLNNQVVHKDGAVAMTGRLTLAALDPTAADHAARKSYVDSVAGGPIGAVIPFAGLSAPSGWLLCFGQAVSRTTYANLFAVIGTSYGNGDGSTTFNVPDLRGRIPVALDNMGGVDAGRLSSANTLGTAGGEEKHTLTEVEIPAHAHGSPIGGNFVIQGVGNFNAGLTIANGGAEASTTANTGGGGSHNNMQPFITMTYIIKTGV